MTDLDAPRPPAAMPARPAAKPSTARTQRRIRDLHLYLSMLCAPSLLFFAVTGALQLFDLHEARPGASFAPPAILQELGMVHKKQVFALPRRRFPTPDAVRGGPAGEATPPGAPPDAKPPGAGGEPVWKPLALKLFFLLVSVALAASTGMGIWIGVRPGRNRGLAWGLLAAGAALPILLLAL